MAGLVDEYIAAYREMDYEKLTNLWHPEYTFADPAFPNLDTTRSRAMFHMFITNRDKNKMVVTHITPAVASDTQENTYVTTYTCDYLYGAAPVHNEIRATIELKDGKIWRQVDEFPLAAWAKQSLGMVGTALNVVGMLDGVVKKKAAEKLDVWCAQNEEFKWKE
ncbi:hypothetical protein L873DRAFT_1810109 [Choiromyces venosus 120613-1]|uniref:SnoaL-like domain-containing protein n=1 Tax=Choiromyces venosus 120613-1 TaxID=1336337 RepID=A0A3N4JG85_9PEZI|nr:hypothetical protein L873DRAFT_1810109 [Choiromyces venosus 120613-1]